MTEPIKVVCGHCNADVSNAPQVVAANARIEALEARVERAKAFSEMTRNDHGFDCVAAKPLLAILEGDTE